MIYQFDLSGELDRSFEGRWNPTTALAWDSDRNLLWTSGTVTDIAGFDIEGNAQAEFDRQDMRIYGLSYWPDDPDGFNLYISQNDRDEDVQPITKMNTEDGELRFVRAHPLRAGGNPRGAFITNTYDVYSWVLISLISNAPGNGGDRIDIWQLDVRRDWFDITPLEGEIAAGETAEFTVHFDSNGLSPKMKTAIFTIRNLTSATWAIWFKAWVIS